MTEQARQVAPKGMTVTALVPMPVSLNYELRKISLLAHKHLSAVYTEALEEYATRHKVELGKVG